MSSPTVQPKYIILDDQYAARYVRARNLDLQNQAKLYGDPQQMAEHIEALHDTDESLTNTPLVVLTDGDMYGADYSKTSTDPAQGNDYIATEAGTLKALHQAHEKQQIGDYAVIIHSGNVGVGDYGDETDINQLSTDNITINPKDRSQAIRIAKSVDELEPLTKALQLATRAVTSPIQE